MNNCSLNENSGIWKDKQKENLNQNQIQSVFSKKTILVKEFNQNLNLKLSNIKTKNSITGNHNNYGSQNYDGKLNKIGSYKFSKFESTYQINTVPVFFDNGVIYFDKKGSIINYDHNKKILWKKNFYTKQERKLYPKLNFYLDQNNLLVTDNIAKFYSVNINTTELNWSKFNKFPFNSDIKKYKDKFFVIDYKNILRCYRIKDGSECWNLQTEDSFTISNSKYSLIVIDDKVIFSNSIGDITAVDVNKGTLIWQLPTQSSNIINETYNFKTSKLVADNNSIYISNNKNQFYSIDVKTGTTNWISDINSHLTPVIIGNLIFTISNKGLLYVIEKNKGNIIRISNLFSTLKEKKRNSIYPIGFSVGNKILYLTNSDGKMIIANLESSEVVKIIKVTSNIISKPLIFNNYLFLITNGSIIQYN